MSGDGFPYPVDRAGNFATATDEGLTARLRQCLAGERTYVGDLMREAADRISQLEKENARLRASLAAMEAPHV